MSILERILARRRERLAEDLVRVPRAAMRERALAAPVPPSWGQALRAAGTEAAPALIAEIKRASPSAGVLRAELDAERLAHAYAEGGAAALSVLTEPDFFSGSLADLERARGAGLPILRKDFFFDPYQLDEARARGASAVLLILAMLDEASARSLLHAARELGLDVLVETHDEEELERALALGADWVGVNNRDLRSFTVDLGRAERLRQRVPASVGFVAESGIAGAEDARRLRAAGCDAMLVGTELVRAPDPVAAVRALLGGDRR